MVEFRGIRNDKCLKHFKLNPLLPPKKTYAGNEIYRLDDCIIIMNLLNILL